MARAAPRQPQTAGAASGAAAADFSLVVGGPLYQLLRRTRLSTEGLGLVHRRIILAVLVMWAPLMVLTALQGGLLPTGPVGAVGSGHANGAFLPFIDDLANQLRFLVAAPLLILSELIVHRRMRPIVAQFRERGLIPARAMADYTAALDQAARWRNSILAEVMLLVAVYAVGLLFTLKRYLNFGGAGWFALPGGGLSPAGWWMMLVSLPLVQFLLLRWYFRLFIWARFMWRVSRLDLDLNATHPDKAGGLGFLSESLAAFAPIAGAHGVMFAGMMADRILFGGAKLTDFQAEVAGGAAFLLAVFVGPLLIWLPKLARTKRAGVRAYGAVGQIYAREFREKWMAGKDAGEPLMGSGDIQSLADLGNSYAAGEQMRLAPIQAWSLAAFVGAFLLPMAPLLLTMMSLEKLLGQLVGVVF